MKSNILSQQQKLNITEEQKLKYRLVFKSIITLARDTKRLFKIIHNKEVIFKLYLYYSDDNFDIIYFDIPSNQWILINSLNNVETIFNPTALSGLLHYIEPFNLHMIETEVYKLNVYKDQTFNNLTFLELEYDK